MEKPVLTQIEKYHPRILHFITPLRPTHQVTNTSLSVILQEGDYDGLVHVMQHLGNVKDRQEATDGMFEPLKQTIELLKTYNQEMPDEVHQLLEVSEN